VCGSDWHAWKGHDAVPLPHIPGHELAGTVAQAGPAVTRWRPGDRVTLPFACGCGRCEYCRAGEAQVCPDQTQPGFTGPGSFHHPPGQSGLGDLVQGFAHRPGLIVGSGPPAAQDDVARRAGGHPRRRHEPGGLPDAVDAVTAASLGYRLATAYRALTGHARLRPGEWLAVHGCGGVGLSAVHIGAALGARVIAVDVAGPALERARDLGAEHTILSATNTDPAHPASSIRRWPSPVLASSTATISSAFSCRNAFG
jgi:alcohol dehydrogenase